MGFGDRISDRVSDRVCGGSGRVARGGAGGGIRGRGGRQGRNRVTVCWKI